MEQQTEDFILNFKPTEESELETDENKKKNQQKLDFYSFKMKMQNESRRKRRKETVVKDQKPKLIKKNSNQSRMNIDGDEI